MDGIAVKTALNTGGKIFFNRKSRKTVAPLSGYSECRSGTLLFFGRGFLLLFLSLLRLFFSGRFGFGLSLRRFSGFLRSLGGLRCGAGGLGLYRAGFRNYRLRLHRRRRLGLFHGHIGHYRPAPVDPRPVHKRQEQACYHEYDSSARCQLAHERAAA